MGQLLTNRLFATMSINNRLITLRREQNLTQQEIADRVGLHVNQIRRYEAGTAQPSLEALKKIALAMSVTIDSLVFENNERGPNDEFKLQFEAVCQLPDDDKRAVKALLEGMLIKHQTKQMVRGLSS
jgi:transcriptional regulator with XRE-family HTH domain